jgi:hypothetical protein
MRREQPGLSESSLERLDDLAHSPDSINGQPPRILDKIPYGDMDSCRAEKAVRKSRLAKNRLEQHKEEIISVDSYVFCLEEPSA